ncbi:response regulator [Belnapia sp. T6]|uniref:Response regulator n=2 Tax=Belnapia mucosa TaxID=2804532 RepID=A0ABS1VBC7_9PROT|nr:response regulator [Belnapia mucosa]
MPQRRTTLRDRRVLIVEDEALLTMLLEDGLSEAGAEVVGSAGTVFEALQIIERVAQDGGLDAAVLDINLAGESVTPVANQLAALGVPFLFATGYGTDCDMGAHAAAPVLHKPFATERLVAVLEAIVSFTPDGAGAFWRD